MLQILMFIFKISLSFRKKKQLKGTCGSLNIVGLNVKYDSGETSLFSLTQFKFEFVQMGFDQLICPDSSQGHI